MKKRMISIMMVMMLVVSLFTACSNKEDGKSKEEQATSTNNAEMTVNGIDISKPVTIKMYLLGDRTKDFDKVYEEINKRLKEKVNATVEVEFLSWSEHDTKYSLLFSGGEDFDLIFTASDWGHYETTVSMGGFYPLTTEFIQTYAPDIYKVVPEIAWEQAAINGSTYMVPNYQNEFGADVIAVRGDLMEKYGYSNITSLDELKSFYNDVVTNEQGITPLGTQGGGLEYPYLLDKGVATIAGGPSELFVYNTLDSNDLSITYELDWDGFTDYCNQMKEMYDKGFWSPDSLVTTEERQDGFLKGTSASMIWNLGSCKKYVDEANKAHPEWKCTIIDLSPNVPKKVNSYINNAVAINAASKNKERAMMVLNEFYTNKEIFDLAHLGIEGVHWKAVGEDQYTLLAANTDYGADSNCNWGWTNMEIKRSEYVENPDATYEKQQAILDSWNANVKAGHVYDGFTFNSEVVSSETAAVGTVITQYYTPLICGMAGDVDVAMEELRKQLDKAGIQTIYEEMKKQAEEFANSKK